MKLFEITQINEIETNQLSRTVQSALTSLSNKIQSLIIPKGCANAFLTLKDNTIVHYITNKNYNQKFEKGIKYDDSKYKVKWPFRPKKISSKDLMWPYHT